MSDDVQAKYMAEARRCGVKHPSHLAITHDAPGLESCSWSWDRQAVRVPVRDAGHVLLAPRHGGRVTLGLEHPESEYRPDDIWTLVAEEAVAVGVMLMQMGVDAGARPPRPFYGAGAVAEWEDAQEPVDAPTVGDQRRAWIEAMDGTPSPAAEAAPTPAPAPSLAERVAGLESALGIVSETLAMHHSMLGELFDAEHFPLTLAAELLEDLAGYEDYMPPEWIRERAMLAKRVARLEELIEDAERDRARLRSMIAELDADVAELRGGCPGCGATDDDDDVCVCDCAVPVEEGSP